MKSSSAVVNEIISFIKPTEVDRSKEQVPGAAGEGLVGHHRISLAGSAPTHRKADQGSTSVEPLGILRQLTQQIHQPHLLDRRTPRPRLVQRWPHARPRGPPPAPPPWTRSSSWHAWSPTSPDAGLLGELASRRLVQRLFRTLEPTGNRPHALERLLPPAGRGERGARRRPLSGCPRPP